MIERIEGMPAGTVGFRAAGEVTADDYRGVLEPALREAAESGEIRMLYLLERGFRMDFGAVARDARTGLAIGLGRHSSWKRSAIVTDAEWVTRAMHAFAWMVPGELRVFPIAELDDARAWVAG